MTSEVRIPYAFHQGKKKKKEKKRWQLGTLLLFLKILRVYFVIADRNVFEDTVTQQHLAYSVYFFPLYLSIDLKLL